MDLSSNLLENLKFENNYIILQNKYVHIIITKFNNVFVLDVFYNKLNIKNAARCGLYFLLEELLKREILTFSTIIYVNDISPSDGGRRNTEAYIKLIKIYEDIGFVIESGDIERKNVVMASPVSNLMEVLRDRCVSKPVGGKKKTRKNGKSVKRNRRTKRRRKRV